MKIFTITVLLASMLQCHGEASSVFSVLMNQIWECLGQTGIVDPSVSRSSDVEVLKTVLRYTGNFSMIMQCTPFRQRQGPAGQFLVNTFHFIDNHAAEMVEIFNEVQQEDLNCLGTMNTANMDSVDGTDFFEECLTESDISPYTQNTYRACNVYRPDAEKSCTARLVARQCTNNVHQVISILMNIIFGACKYFPPTTASPPTTPRPYEDWMYSLPFYTCQDYTQTLNMFPPSDFSRPYITNTTEGQLELQQVLADFCFPDNFNTYTTCVARAFMNTYLELFYNVNRVGSAFEILCSNRELLVSQYVCTYQKVLENTCRGGILDLWERINENLSSFTATGYSCSDINDAVTCRIDKQLKPCGAYYAEVMRNVTDLLLTPECRQGSVNPNTDALPCVEALWQSLMSTYVNLSSSLDIDTVLEATNYVCSEIDSVLTCIETRIQPSDKIYDVFLKQLFSFDNIRLIVKYTCKVIPDFLRNAQCITNQYTAMAASSNSCFNQIFSQDTTAIDSVQLVCNTVEQMRVCYIPVMSACDADLGEAYDKLMSAMSASCNKPNYKLGNIDDCGGGKCPNSSPANVSISRTLLSAFVVVMTVVHVFM